MKFFLTSLSDVANYYLTVVLGFLIGISDHNYCYKSNNLLVVIFAKSLAVKRLRLVCENGSRA